MWNPNSPNYPPQLVDIFFGYLLVDADKSDKVDGYNQWLSDKVNDFGYSDYEDTNSSANSSESIESLMEKRHVVFKLHHFFGGGMRNCSWCSCLNMWGNRFFLWCLYLLCSYFLCCLFLDLFHCWYRCFWREQWNSNIDIFRLCKTHSKSKSQSHGGKGRRYPSSFWDPKILSSTANCYHKDFANIGNSWRGMMSDVTSH